MSDPPLTYPSPSLSFPSPRFPLVIRRAATWIPSTRTQINRPASLRENSTSTPTAPKNNMFQPSTLPSMLPSTPTSTPQAPVYTFDWRPSQSMAPTLPASVRDITQPHWEYLRQFMHSLQINYNQLHAIHHAADGVHNDAMRAALEGKSALCKELRAMRAALHEAIAGPEKAAVEAESREDAAMKELEVVEELKAVEKQVELLHEKCESLEKSAKVTYNMLQGSMAELNAYREKFGPDIGDEAREKRKKELEALKDRSSGDDKTIKVIVWKTDEATLRGPSEASPALSPKVVKQAPKTRKTSVAKAALKVPEEVPNTLDTPKTSAAKASLEAPKTSKTPVTKATSRTPKTVKATPYAPETPDTPKTVKTTPKAPSISINKAPPKTPKTSAAKAPPKTSKTAVKTNTRTVPKRKHDNEIEDWMNGSSSSCEGGYDSTSLAGY